MTKTGKLLTGAILLSLNSCTVPLLSEQDQPPDFIPANIMAIPNATPRFEPRTRAGNPPEYEVLGQRYRTLNHSHNYQIYFHKNHKINTLSNHNNQNNNNHHHHHFDFQI